MAQRHLLTLSADTLTVFHPHLVECSDAERHGASQHPSFSSFSLFAIGKNHPGSLEKGEEDQEGGMVASQSLGNLLESL